MKAYRLEAGSARWFVRGTEDVDEAFAFLLDTTEAAEDVWIEGDLGFDLELFPEVERAGWFRFSPCFCGEHGWHLDLAKGPGRGNFLGVWMDVGAVEAQFDCDDVLTGDPWMLETV